MKKIRAICWDWGGVAIHFHIYDMYRLIGALFSVTPQAVHNFWTSGEPTLWARCDLGRYGRQWYSPIDIYDVFVRHFVDEKKKGPPVLDFYHAFNSGGTITLDERYIPLASQIQNAGVLQYVISDINHIHYAYVYENFFDIFQFYERLFCSCAEGMSKRVDSTAYFRKIFEKIYKEAHIAPDEIVFFDNLPENIDGFHQAGGQGVLVTEDTGLAGVEAALYALGVLK